MANYLSPIGNGVSFIDANGNPLSGALLFTYTAGSSSKKTTYTTEAGVANTNPIVLDSSGRPPYPIWLIGGTSYKFVLAPSTDSDPPVSAIRTWDDIDGINDTSVSIDEWVSGPTPTYVSGTQFTLAGDQTSTFQVGRRVKCTVTAGTVYGRISVSSYVVLTTITVVLDSGALDSGLNAVSYGLASATNPSIDVLGVKRAANKEGDTFTGAVTFSAAPTVRIDDATTNAVTTAATLSHTSTGAPANNIGVGLNFEVETSADNNEVGAKIEAIATDTTAASEDFKLSFKTMVAGAAAAEAGYIAQGLVVGSSPTGGDLGAGYINVSGGVSVNNSPVPTTSPGSYTPGVTLVGGAGNTIPVYSSKTGYYQVIGNGSDGRIVFADIYLDGDGGNEGAGTGQLTISLPVAASASNASGYAAVGRIQNGANSYPLFGQIAASDSTISLAYLSSATTVTTATGAEQSSTTRNVKIKVWYRA